MNVELIHGKTPPRNPDIRIDSNYTERTMMYRTADYAIWIIRGKE
jgi:hypothetical protein